MTTPHASEGLCFRKRSLLLILHSEKGRTINSTAVTISNKGGGNPMKLKELYRCIACVTLVAPTLVFAQQAPEIEEVVVTGSLIRGTPVDAALPVEVRIVLAVSSSS
jgi:hypothetical protein